MGKIKEIKDTLKLLDYLKEKGILIDDLKTMIDEQVDTALEESKVKEEKKEEPPTDHQEGDVEEEEVPTFTKEDVEQLIADEVKKSLKIKRKVPSKGKLVDKKEVDKQLQTKREIFAKDTFEELV